MRYSLLVMLLLATACSSANRALPVSGYGMGNAPTAFKSAAKGRAAFIYFTALGAVYTYAATANGNLKPNVLIKGNKTHLAFIPSAIEVTGNGSIWVCSSDKILHWAPGTKGNVAPVSTIKIDRLCDDLQSTSRGIGIVQNVDANKGRYSFWNKGQTGAPTKTIEGDQTDLVYPGSLAYGNGQVFISENGEINVYKLSDQGNIKPSHVIVYSPASRSGQIAFNTANGMIYLSTTGSIVAFQQGGKKPAFSIQGDKTKLTDTEITGLAIDGAGYIYAYNETFNHFLVFAPGAKGNVAPIQEITPPESMGGRRLTVR